MNRIVFLFLLFTLQSLAQVNKISGVVSDNLNVPLESANLIAIPKNNKTVELKFSITDEKGRFEIELEPNVEYDITASYIGFIDEILQITSAFTTPKYNFVLIPTGENLKEIVIKNDFKPIEIKKDTLTYDLKSFVNGSERKMKDALLKLPGVTLDKKGNVFVQGKRVTKMLIENKSFFGGGSKLAIENIPADAINKIEVIDHFNEVNFLKKVSDSEDLAMNVKLKDSKKKFVFGDVATGIEAGIDDNGFYLLHTGLFYYSPKTSISYIGDSNNIGKSTLTFEDLMRFEGGYSNFLSGRKSFTNLFSFIDENTEIVQNKSNFSALNVSADVSKKMNIIGFGIFSKIFTATQNENNVTYFQNNLSNFENQNQAANNKSILGIVNLKLDYSANKLEKWFYNVQLKSSNNSGRNTLNTISNNNNNVFETLNNADNLSLKQFIEWHKNINDTHTATFVINQAFDKNTPTTNWLSTAKFLNGLIPLQNDVLYNVNQLKNSTNSSVDVLLRHYFTINDSNLITTSLGNNFGKSILKTSENQLLSNRIVNDFENAGFTNDILCNLNETYLNIEHKLNIGIWTNKSAVSVHNYSLKIDQFSGMNKVNKLFVQPNLTSELKFNKSEFLRLNYKLTNVFPEINQFANRFTLQNYNLVFKGNALLENQIFHSTNLEYSKSNLFKHLNINAGLSYNKKTNNLRNEINLNGINQFLTATLNPNPETNWNFTSTFGRKFYRFIAKIDSDLSWFTYSQKINNIETLNNRNGQNVALSLATSYKKWPDISLEYSKQFSQFSGISSNEFQSEALSASFETRFFKNFSFKVDYQYQKNINENQSNYFDIANSSLRYQKKDSPFEFEFIANNLLNTKSKNDNSFSDYLFRQSKTFILPRVLIISVSYKL